jgi:hypothetical protein
MLRRMLLVKLMPEFSKGLELAKVRSLAEQALRPAYGVQAVRTEEAADDATREQWDICISIDYVSGVDEERSARDPIRKAFEQNFLGTRAERVWSGVFRPQKG